MHKYKYTISARVTADIYLRAYIALHKYTIKNTQIHNYKYTNTQKQMHTDSGHISVCLYCTALLGGSYIQRILVRLPQIRKYRHGQDICWWDTGMTQPGKFQHLQRKVFQNFKKMFKSIQCEMDIEYICKSTLEFVNFLEGKTRPLSVPFLLRTSGNLTVKLARLGKN